jgi:hypothetical protein
MGSKPSGDGLNRPVRENIDQALGLQVHDDRAIGTTTPKGKVVETDLGECFRGNQKGGLLTAQKSGRGPLHSQVRS